MKDRKPLRLWPQLVATPERAPIQLSATEQQDLVAFLRTLSGSSAPLGK